MLTKAAEKRKSVTADKTISEMMTELCPESKNNTFRTMKTGESQIFEAVTKFLRLTDSSTGQYNSSLKNIKGIHLIKNNETPCFKTFFLWAYKIITSNLSWEEKHNVFRLPIYNCLFRELKSDSKAKNIIAGLKFGIEIVRIFFGLSKNTLRFEKMLPPHMEKTSKKVCLPADNASDVWPTRLLISFLNFAKKQFKKDQKEETQILFYNLMFMFLFILRPTAACNISEKNIKFKNGGVQITVFDFKNNKDKVHFKDPKVILLPAIGGNLCPVQICKSYLSKLKKLSSTKKAKITYSRLDYQYKKLLDNFSKIVNGQKEIPEEWENLKLPLTSVRATAMTILDNAKVNKKLIHLFSWHHSKALEKSYLSKNRFKHEKEMCKVWKNIFTHL